MPAPKITIDYLEKLIKKGYGQGSGMDYKPWIPIKRWNPSKISTQTAGNLPFQHKRGAFLSQNEWNEGLVMTWLSKDIELREQYPLWPWEHPHPLVVYSGYENMAYCRGLIEVCNDAGIDHGRFIGTNIPYIWTGDLMVTVLNDTGERTCVLVSLKSLENEKYKNPDPLDRTLEKLEIERRYTVENNLGYFISSTKSFSSNLLNNLKLLYTAAYLPETDRRFHYLQRFLDRYADDADEYPIESWREWIQADNKATLLDAIFVVYHILWHQFIDANLNLEIRNNCLVKPGGRALKNRLLNNIKKGVC